MKILKLDIAGRPIGWITREDGALLYCRDQAPWKAGEQIVVLRGGVTQRVGSASRLRVS